MDQLNALDVRLLQGINALGERAPWLDDLMIALSSHALWIVLAVVALVAALVYRSRNVLKACVVLGIAVGLSDLVTYQVLKPGFGRPRPCHQEIELRLVQNRCGGDYGFPSNHAANGMAIATVLALHFRRRDLTTAAIVIAGAVGLSRSYLGVHFPGDILSGFVVGSTVGSGVWLAFSRGPLARRLIRLGLP
jgi:undecaprenyl-diphosphatase